MSVLIALDQVTLYPPSEDLDEHGWRLAGDEVTWEGTGNLQLAPGTTDPHASAGGGRGPFGPARDEVGQLFLPPDAPVLEGSIAEVRGRRYVLTQTRAITDPSGDDIDCWVATAISIDTWPKGGERAS